MKFMDHIDTILNTSIIVATIVFIIFFNKIKTMFLNIFGGSLDKVEFAGIIFTAILSWMIYREGTRDHEWHYFNELYVLVVSGAAVTGLGMKSMLKGIKDIRTAGGGDDAPEPPKKEQVPDVVL